MTAKLLAGYVVGVLSYDASMVIIGRENFIKSDSSTSYIIIDELLNTPVGSTYSYDGDTEEETFNTVSSTDFTIDFYGSDARTNAATFRSLQRGQTAYELQRDLGISVNHVSLANNLRALEGSQFVDRYQLSLSVVANDTVTIDTLRIDTANLEFLNDK